ncbi:hypothetical protein JMM59_04705 [Rhodovulum sulfidophilum]|uniref:hypothetical protein n=1 Tax=Rhodovulum sulfidophilum TaxID=35806 RepID=UPI001922A636|nr:hypothetical protein [Rhodovulum sulfidophilum]MBL3564312.1 hypothetical protein [Rhodovulum sulfidophilum]
MAIDLSFLHGAIDQLGDGFAERLVRGLFDRLRKGVRGPADAAAASQAVSHQLAAGGTDPGLGWRLPGLRIAQQKPLRAARIIGQAGLLFRELRRMIKAAPALSAFMNLGNKHVITTGCTNGTIRTLSRDGNSSSSARSPRPCSA